MSVRSVSVEVVARMGRYTGPMSDAIKTTKQFREELSETARKGTGEIDAIANGMLGWGAAIGAAVAGVVVKGAEFEHAMAQVNAVSGATADEFESLKNTALEMGSTTAFSASEAAAATEELAKAGLSAADITGGALAGALDLAAAGGIGLAEAASLAATSMSQFGLEAHEVNRVADTLAGAANSSNTGVSELGQALKNAGTVAAQSGLEMEETVGILSAFADNALGGAEAGTALKTTLLRLLAPTGAAKRELDRLGVAVYDSNGNAKSAVDIVRELEKALSTLTMEQRASALSVIFGSEALAGANILLKEGADGIAAYIDQVSEQGVAADTAGKRLDSLKGDITLLNSAMEGLAVQSSGGATDGLRTLTQMATELLGQVNDLPAPLLNAVVVIGAVTAAALLLGGTMLKVQNKVAAFNTSLAATGPAGAKAAGGLQRATMWAGRAVGVFAAIQVGSAILSSLMEDLNPQIDAFAVGLQRWTTTGEIAGEAARIMGDDFEKLGQSLESAADSGFTRGLADAIETTVPFMKNMDDSLAKSVERVEALDSALAMLQQTDPTAAAEAWALVAAEAQQQGIELDRLKEVFPQYQAALEVAAAATEDAADTVSPYAFELEVLAAQFNLTGDTAQEALSDMLAAWSDGATAFISLTGAYQDALGELEDDAELTSQGFIEQLRKQRKAQEEWADNMTTLAERGVGDMIHELAQLGPEGAEMVALMADMTDAELQEVVELWGYRGDEVGQGIAAGILEGTASGIEGVNHLQGAIDLLQDKEITITVNRNELYNRRIISDFGETASTFNRWGGVYTRAREGVLRHAQIFGPVAPARYAFAEPETGGEAFIPKRGNAARSLSILSKAAAWYGAQVVPNGRHQWRGQQPVTITSPDAEPGPMGGRVRGRADAVVVERQEIAVHAHTNTFSYRQVMDEFAWHGVY